MSKTDKHKRKSQTKPSSSKAIILSPKILPVWLIIVIFALTTIIYFWGQLSGSYFFWEDFAEFIYPTQTFAAVETAGGNIPFWNPFTFAGMPFLADLQNGYFYPFNRLLSLFVTNDGMLPIWILQFIVIIHFFFAQLNMYYLCKKWGTSQIAGIIAALSFAFSLVMVFRSIHPMIIYHLAWFPLVVLIYHKAISTLKLKSAIWAGLILGFTFLSGHPQYTLFLLMFLFFFALWLFVHYLIKQEFTSRKLVKFVFSAIIPVIVSAGIFMIQYLPSQKLADLSQRAEMTYEKASESSMQIKQVMTFISPNFFGQTRPNADFEIPFYLTLSDTSTGKDNAAPYYYYWETAFYLGIIGFILALIGFWFNLKDVRFSFLLFISFLGFLYALGSNGFLHKLFFYLPFFGNFRNPGRLMFYLTFAFSIASAFGFDSLWKLAGNKKLFRSTNSVIGIIIFICLLGILGLWSSVFDTPEKIITLINQKFILPLILSIIFLIVAYFLFKVKLSINIAGLILAVFIFIDLYIVANPFVNSNVNPQNTYKIDNAIIKAFLPQNPDDLFRVNYRSYQPPYTAFLRNQGLVSRFMNIEGYNPLILQRVIPPLNSRDTIHQLYNIKYEIRFNEQNQPYFYERSDRLGYAWIVHNAIITVPDNIENTMRYGGFDYSKTVILEEKLEKTYNSDNDSIQSFIKCLDFGLNYAKYEVQTESDGILCFSEIWYPDWKAYINGSPRNLLRANYCFRAVEIPAGKTIEIKYESSEFFSGMYIAIFVLICSILALIFIKEKDDNGEKLDITKN